MKFFYRGASYESKPSSLEITEGEIGGMYRGQQWKTHNYKQNRPRYTIPHNLTYRGAVYKQQ